MALSQGRVSRGDNMHKTKGTFSNAYKTYDALHKFSPRKP